MEERKLKFRDPVEQRIVVKKLRTSFITIFLNLPLPTSSNIFGSTGPAD